MSAQPNERPVLDGYAFLEHLGSGGYGDVWSARVPGGLEKAVKIVHGRLDESRAANELKALERIREVRHPFVVSLERVEFADNRLIVVSELAEKSLRDRFRECVGDGLAGIPREELLSYLRDAADALDYLTAKHSLQHLDVKPENILLLAGHAKVADFGLVKALDDKSQSIVGGMTPAYAPPEVFKGSPCRASDQYSLAVLYQQLLTGTLPFDGENAAELTLQHLNDEPDLGGLSEDDRYVVSRALSKTPEHRYATCSEFVQALSSSQGSSFSQGSTSSAPTSPRGSDNSGPAEGARPGKDHRTTAVFEDDAPRLTTDLRMSHPASAPPTLTEQPAPDFDDQFAVTPTLFLGIGGAAACVLRELRQQHSEQHELSGPIPAMPMLLFDTNQQTFSTATRNASSGAGLKREETACLALRRPQEYREKADKILGWLGRRWLYNIPKSLQTEGIRPLGRLALVDNSRRTLQRIRGALMECVSPENIEASEQQTGLRFKRDAVRVYVVASIAGATGGGMSLDIAYAVRSAIEKLGLPDARLIGINLFSTGRDAERAGLARVNAYSWLAEHQHFCHAGNAYPGDESAGLPPHDANERPFDDSYLVHLGDRLDDAAFLEGCKSVADYLFVDAGTPGQNCLDACRAATADAGQGLDLRTFAADRHEAAPADARRDAEQLLTNLLLSSWLGESRAKSTNEATSTNRVVMGAGELVGRLKIDAAQLATRCRALVQAEVDKLPPADESQADLIERLEATNSHFEPSPDLNKPLLGETGPNRIGALAIVDLVRPVADELQSAIAEWVSSHLNSPGERLTGGQQAADWLHDHCESLTGQFQRFGAATHQKLTQVVQHAQAPNPDGAALEARYRHLKGDLAALEGAALVAAGIKTELREVMKQLGELRAAAGSVANELSNARHDDATETHQLLAEAGAAPARLAVELDGRLQEEWRQNETTFAGLLESDAGRRELVSAVRRHAHQCVREALMRRAEGNGPAVNAEPVTSPLADYCPGFRQILLTPNGAATPELPAGVISIPHTTGDSYFLTEYEGLSAPHAAVSLVGGRRDYAEFAKRVSTRRDIAWNDPLAPPPPPATAADFAFPTMQVAVETNNDAALIETSAPGAML